MFDLHTFQSRSEDYKTPYGAVPAGTPVSFTLRPARNAGFSRAILTARLEFEGDKIITCDLPWVGLENGRDLFSGTLDTGPYIGLVWYSFRLEGIDGRHAQSQEYRLIIYDGTASVPSWFGEGMTYQIFPDRFHRSRLRDPSGMVGDRWVHENWDDPVEYRPDHRGEVRNRDFFGGDLAGVEEKLDYLHGLGVETLYFCPLFEAPENHRYGTGDYEVIDPMLGDNADFTRLCERAHALGMKVMLDGVFNHVGYVSRYFNGDGSYGPDTGAARDQNSPFYPWFNFRNWPNSYEAWWDFYSLPSVNEMEPSYVDYIIENENSIIRRWLRAGADAWRLDVADELPDEFIRKLNSSARREKPHAIVVGEVWEDGSTKIAYGERRRHVHGGYCDSLMNYPLRNALIDYLLGGDAHAFMDTMEALREGYPREIFYSCMNALGTHDTPRILTLLGVGSTCAERTKAWRAEYRMDEHERARGLARFRIGMVALFAFPGSPTVYYGDEAGMEGFEDPFNRATFPWGHENADLTALIATLGRLRKGHTALRGGDISYITAEGHVLTFARTNEHETIAAALNAGHNGADLNLDWAAATDLLTGEAFAAEEGEPLSVPLPPMGARLLLRQDPPRRFAAPLQGGEFVAED